MDAVYVAEYEELIVAFDPPVTQMGAGSFLVMLPGIGMARVDFNDGERIIKFMAQYYGCEIKWPETQYLEPTP